MKYLELKVPPLILVVIFSLLIGLIGHHDDSPMLQSNTEVVLWALIALAAVATCLSGVWEFRRHQTSVNPTTPESSHSLVRSGIYQYTRNPMYLGFALLLLALCGLSGSLYSLIVPPLFIWYVTVFQVIPEEKVLHGIFGARYTQYKKKVRRWL